jgi:hypothetical protein
LTELQKAPFEGQIANGDFQGQPTRTSIHAFFPLPAARQIVDALADKIQEDPRPDELDLMEVEMGMPKIGDIGVDQDLLDLGEERIFGLRTA